jgi:hypothetical protein
MKRVFGMIILIVLLLALAAISPIITIWALNTLFALGIVLTFETWLAVFWMYIIIGSVSGNLKAKH